MLINIWVFDISTPVTAFSGPNKNVVMNSMDNYQETAFVTNWWSSQKVVSFIGDISLDNNLI